MDRETEDFKFMRDPDKWPRWPLLPVKRSTNKGNWPELGILVAGRGPVVHKASLYDDHDTIKKANTVTFASFEAMVVDGWRVD